MNKIKIKNDIKDNMKGEYIIINKADIQKRIEEFQELWKAHSTYPNRTDLCINYTEKIELLEELLSQSTPLVPEIEKAFDAGSENPRIGGSYPMFEMEKEQNNAKQFYILNLKI